VKSGTTFKIIFLLVTIQLIATFWLSARFGQQAVTNPSQLRFRDQFHQRQTSLRLFSAGIIDKKCP